MHILWKSINYTGLGISYILKKVGCYDRIIRCVTMNYGFIFNYWEVKSECHILSR